MYKRLTRDYPDLKTWRDTLGLSQHEAARVLDMSQSTYARLELRRGGTTGKRARKIWRQTGVPIAVLVGAV